MTQKLPPAPSNPWITHSTESVFENDWFRVETSAVTTPGNTAGQYGVVRMANRSVGVIPYENGHVWMVGQTRYALNQYSWEIPEGGVPKGEDMLAAARRELKEETGLSARTLTHLLNFHPSNSITDEYGEIYLATGLTRGVSALELTEDITSIRIPLSDLISYIESGQITDVMTIMAAYKLRLMQLAGELE